MRKRKPFDEEIPLEICNPIGDAFDLVTAFTVVAERRIEKGEEDSLDVLRRCRAGINEQLNIIEERLKR